MCVRRFGAHVAAGPRGRGVIAFAFDPDEVWGAARIAEVDLLAAGIKQRPRPPRQPTTPVDRPV